jgi:excisionase family DNA binding protein
MHGYLECCWKRWWTKSRPGLRGEAQAMLRPKTADAERPDDTPLLLKAEDVARLLGIGRTKVYEMMASGELPVVRIGTAVRVPRQRLLDWIEENTQEAA